MRFYLLGSFLVVFFVFLIFLFNLIFYKNHLKDKKITPHYLLLLRVISLLFLLILLMEPFFSFFKDKPNTKHLNLYIDNSKSMSHGISTDSLNHYTKNIKKWAEERGYVTSTYLFGDSLREEVNLNLDDKITKYDNLINYINIRSNDLNIIMTDGNATHGFKISNLESHTPLHIIGVGESTFEDILIKEVISPLFISQNDSLDILIEIESTLNSEKNATLEIILNGILSHSREINLGKGENIYHKRINLATNNFIGEIDLDVMLNGDMLKDPKSNNYYKTRIFINDSYNDVLLITGSLTPNTQTIKKILNYLPDISLSHLFKTGNNWDKLNQDIYIKNKDLIIYDNFPIDKTDLEFFKKIESFKSRKSKTIYFEGSLYDFNTMNNIFLGEKQFSSTKNSVRKNFINSSPKIQNLPPVNRNIIIENKDFNIIHLQYSDSTVAIAETNNNLYFFIPELSSITINDGYSIFGEYISNIIHLFMDSGESIFITTSEREIYSGKKVIINFSYPDIYNNLNTELVIENTLSKEKEYIQLNKLKVDSNNNRYIDELGIGSYLLYLDVTSNNNTYKSNSISLEVIENNYENTILYRNENEMRAIASLSDGSYYNIEDYKNIKSLMIDNLTHKNKKVELNVHSFHKFWFILLITLIIEWFIRKQKGLL